MQGTTTLNSESMSQCEKCTWKGRVLTRFAALIRYVFTYKFRHNFEASGYRVCALSPYFWRINNISFIIFINIYNPLYELFIILTVRYKFSHSHHVVVVACFITTHISTRGLYFMTICSWTLYYVACGVKEKAQCCNERRSDAKIV